jgi:spore coat polysaccharide biosynthesis protein SpsF
MDRNFERNLKVVAIIQARMGSTRLPGKVLKDLADGTVLSWVVNRTRRAGLLHQVVVATSDLPTDDAIVRECDRLGVACFRGDEADVLDRYYQAALHHSANIIIRITSDCPLIDPELIDEHVRRLVDGWGHVDLVTNMGHSTYPLGLAVEAMPFDVLARMHRLSDSSELREHVTTLAYVSPNLFRWDHVKYSLDLSHLRWTVDTPEDLELVRLIVRHFGSDHFSWTDVLPLLERNPGWLEINRHVAQKSVV